MRNASTNVALERIEPRTTPGSVALVLRNAILAGTLPPGSQLREIPLAADLGISRAPLREALAILVDEGLVVKYPYKGAFVAEMSASVMSEIASLRIRLEPLAIELAWPKLTGPGPGPGPGPGHVAVTRALEGLRIGAANNDAGATIDAHMAFHRAFYELSGHKLLGDYWRSWESQLKLFFSADHRTYRDLDDMVAEHDRLWDIISRGELAEIAREIAVHVHSPAPVSTTDQAISR